MHVCLVTEQSGLGAGMNEQSRVGKLKASRDLRRGKAKATKRKPKKRVGNSAQQQQQSTFFQQLIITRYMGVRSLHAEPIPKCGFNLVLHEEKGEEGLQENYKRGRLSANRCHGQNVYLFLSHPPLF